MGQCGQESAQNSLYGSPWLGRLVPCHSREPVSHPWLIHHSTQTRGRRCSVLPGPPRRALNWPSSAAAQGPVPGIILCPRCAGGAPKLRWFPPSNVRFTLAGEWTVLCPGNHLPSAGQAWGPQQFSRADGRSAAGAQASTEGRVRPAPCTVAWVAPWCPAFLAPACERSPEATRHTACLRGASSNPWPSPGAVGSATPCLGVRDALAPPCPLRHLSLLASPEELGRRA